MTARPKDELTAPNRGSLSSAESAILKQINSFKTDAPDLTYLLENEITNQFLVWTPDRKAHSENVVTPAQSTTIASSRLNQKLEEQNQWFDAIRTLGVQLAAENKFLVTASGTTTDPFVRRISELFQIPIIILEPFPKSPTAKWFREKSKGQGRELQTIAYYKILDNASKTGKAKNVNDLLIAGSQTCFLLSVRNKGNILTAANRRLDNETQPSSTRLLINRSLTPKKVEQALIENGATAWWLFDKPTNDKDHQPPQTQTLVKTTQTTRTPILSLDEIKTENYLLHWTRRRVGPWPDQTQSEFIDDLIFQTSRRNHGGISSLCRILASRRVLGSHNLTRDPRSVVCFADLPLEELPSKRVFRPHLSRWDFESFGIAIERELLAQLGTVKAIYGDEEDWAQLPDEQRPYFQLRKSKSEKIDWESENEWRLVGDLNLELVPHDQAIVFVKTIEDANIVAELSHWPIVVIADNSSSKQ